MINLIRNELSKIFGKKSTYIVFILMFIFIVLTNIIYKTQIDENGNFKEESYNSNYLEFAKEELEDITTSNADKNYELSLRKDIMEYELYEKYGDNSWQAYIVQNNMLSIIDELVNNKYGLEKDELLLTELESEYNLYIEKFDSDDWKYFVNEEINVVNMKIEELEELKNNPRYTESVLNGLKDSYDVELEVLNYRLENNISYASSYLNTAINNYLYSLKYIKSTNIDDIIEQDKLFPTDKYLYEYYENLSSMNVNKYILDNKIDANKVNDNRGILVNLFYEYEMYIVVIIIMFCATIVASEFNKGTIKQLLLVPYTRMQILFSKYITCLLMILFTIFIVILMQVLVGGIVFGFSSLSVPVVIYNFNTSMIETYNIFHYLIIQILAKMPMFIIILTLVFLMGNLTLNSALSIIFGIILYLATPIVSSIAANLNIEILNLLILPHWDFTQYLFGMISDNHYININMSIILCILYFVISLVPSYMIFNKRDIKNM